MAAGVKDWRVNDDSTTAPVRPPTATMSASPLPA